tara:strand:+ start:1357 stop:1548 length:192 start_codon:yes stop_codon:yes gene_type:complete
MKKEIIIIVGSSSWWKNEKYRKEASIKLKALKKKWKISKIKNITLSNKSIDTKIYKKYYFEKL